MWRGTELMGEIQGVEMREIREIASQFQIIGVRGWGGGSGLPVDFFERHALFKLPPLLGGRLQKIERRRRKLLGSPE